MYSGVAGNVGIGDVSPDAKIDILNSGPGASLRVDDDADGDTSPFIIDADGKVGIGTANPVRKLDVLGEARFDGALYAWDATGIGFKDRLDRLGLWVEDGGDVGIGDISADAKLDILNTGSGTSFRVDDDADGDASPFIIDGDGKVGIGATNPVRKLEVFGEGRFDGALYAWDATGIGFKDRLDRLGLWVEDGGDVGVGDQDPDAKLDVLNTGTGSSFRVDDAADGDTSPFIIDADGKVGIGAANPVRKLDVFGEGRFDGALYAWDTTGIGLKDDAENLGLWVADGGNVGIGDVSPDAKLDILNTGTGSSFRVDDAADGDTSPFIIDADGKVGIGAANPVRKLDVFGEGRFDGALYAWDATGIGLKDAAGRSGIWVEDGGNIGIGIDNPTEKLDVDGTARLRQIPSGTGATVVVDSSGRLHKESSSERYKTDIKDLQTDPTAILRLRPVRFQWKTTGQDDIGLIAEDVAQVIKDLVIYDEQGKADAVKYDKLGIYLIEVVRAQQQRIATLEDMLSQRKSLEQRVQALERAMQLQQLALGKEAHQ